MKWLCTTAALLVLLCLVKIPAFSQSGSNVNFAVKGIKQPTDNSCWATVYTMMLSWKLHKKTSIDNALFSVAPRWHQLYKDDAGLKIGEELEFAKDADLKAEPPACYTAKAYIDFLNKYGPLWIAGDMPSHARLLVGVSGYTDEKSYPTTVFRFINPFTGRLEVQKSSEFLSQFEREAWILSSSPDKPFRWQIIHWRMPRTSKS